MSVQMPAADQAVLARRAEIVAALRAIVPGEGVIDAEREMRPFESDGLTAYRQLPMVVVLPETTGQVSEVLEYCHRNGIKVVPRGAGTSLSGGALPLADGVLLGMAKFNCIREIDFDNRVAWPAYNWMGVAKAALESTSRYLAKELGPRGIRCNLVAAGPIRTMAAKSIPGFKKFEDVWDDRAPLGWDVNNSEPVARTTVAMLSDWFPATTGEIIHVDGGYHAMGA